MRRPFLKWAGGKYRLLERILATLPPGRRLVEPFVGSGALFLNAARPLALLCDTNADLIALYTHLQNEGEAFIAYCESFFTARCNTPESFATLRQRFNLSRDSAERAALLLYLNRHGFNGLVRYNGKGFYNVPFGRYQSPPFPREALRAFCALNRESAFTFRAQDFVTTFAALEPGDVVYADPPYLPLSRTANFTAYAGTRFDAASQQTLADCARAAQARGIPVLISNHDLPETRRLYAEAHLHSFEVRRTISCQGQRRGHAPELLALFTP